MPKNYFGDDGVDIVKQNSQNGYYNIYTYGAADQISLTLNKTLVEAGNGNDVVRSNIEFQNDIYLGAGNDTYTGNGFTTYSSRWDFVDGGKGNDTFNISTSVSEYYGDAGNDTFNSVGYSNYLNGGNGVDTVSYLRQDNDSFLSGKGVSIHLYDNEAYTGASRYEELHNFENAKGTSYADDVIGDSGANKLWGMNGRDIVDGRGGNDTLYGGNGSDDLYGGSGNDRLIGNKNNDHLQGDSGADRFIFLKLSDSVVGANRDVIWDFSHSQSDKIDVSAIDDFDFIGSKAFSDTAGELRFKNHILAGDTDGDGKADFEIRVVDVSTLHNNDFIL
jgi:serralysin